MSSELDSFDIICIQEHWLVDRNFSSLLFSDQFMYTAVWVKVGSKCIVCDTEVCE